MEIIPSYYSAINTGVPSSGVTTYHVSVKPWSEEHSWVNMQNQVMLLTSLREIVNDCSQPGWNGDTALPIHGTMVDHAREIINKLPFNIEAPEISPQANGKLAFEWFHGPYHQVMFTVGENREISYAGLLGNKRFYGKQPLSLISDLVEEMRKTYGLDELVHK